MTEPTARNTTGLMRTAVQTLLLVAAILAGCSKPDAVVVAPGDAAKTERASPGDVVSLLSSSPLVVPLAGKGCSQDVDFTLEHHNLVKYDDEYISRFGNTLVLVTDRDTKVNVYISDYDAADPRSDGLEVRSLFKYDSDTPDPMGLNSTHTCDAGQCRLRVTVLDAAKAVNGFAHAAFHFFSNRTKGERKGWIHGDPLVIIVPKDTAC